MGQCCESQKNTSIDNPYSNNKPLLNKNDLSPNNNYKENYFLNSNTKNTDFSNSNTKLNKMSNDNFKEKIDEL